MENAPLFDRLLILNFNRIYYFYITVLLVCGIAVIIISGLSTHSFREYNDQFATIISHYKDKGKSQAEIEFILHEEFPEIQKTREENLKLLFGGIFGVIGSSLQIMFCILALIHLYYKNWGINCLIGSILCILFFIFSFSIILSLILVWLADLKDPKIIKTFETTGWIYLTEKNKSIFDSWWNVKVDCLFWFIVVNFFYILVLFLFILIHVYFNKKQFEPTDPESPLSNEPSNIEEKTKSKEKPKSKSKLKSISKKSQTQPTSTKSPVKILSNVSSDDDDEEI